VCKGDRSGGGPEFFVPLKLALGAKPVSVTKGLMEAVHMFLVLNKSLALILEAYKDPNISDLLVRKQMNKPEDGQRG